MMLLFSVLQERLVRAIATLPNYSSFYQMFALLAAYALFAILLGFGNNFLQWDLCKSKRLIFKVITTSLIAPAILEEILFRVLLLPYPLDGKANSWFVWSIFGLFLFIIYHPLNGFAFFPQGQKTFSNPVFIALAGGLGITCTLSYWQSGSLWLPVIVHWLAVVIWLLCLGGASKLSYK